MLEMLLLSAALSLSADADWQPVIRDQTVQTYKLAVPGSSHAAYRADGTVCASEAELLALFGDVSGFGTWLPRTQLAERLDGDEWSQLLYVVSDAPWPLRSRDMVYRITLGADLGTGQASVDIEGLPEHLPPRRGRVRLAAAAGRWEIHLRDEQVDLVFMLHLDVGRIPSVMASRSLHRAVRDALRNLQNRFPCTP